MNKHKLFQQYFYLNNNLDLFIMNLLTHFPPEILHIIISFMLNYKKIFRETVLPYIKNVQKSRDIVSIYPVFKAGDFSKNRHIYCVEYSVPRYNISETRLQKIGLTRYGPKWGKKNEKHYMYLKNEVDWNNLEGYTESVYSRMT